MLRSKAVHAKNVLAQFKNQNCAGNAKEKQLQGKNQEVLNFGKSKIKGVAHKATKKTKCQEGQGLFMDMSKPITSDRPRWKDGVNG